MPASQASKLFIIYSREDQQALMDLKAHLRPLEKNGDLMIWYDGEIVPGQDWSKAIKMQITVADIILLLISKDFFNSEYIEKEELTKALKRHKNGKAIVVPVIIKHCLWEVYPEISTLQVLPKDGKAISSWTDVDEAFSDVARGVQKLIKVIKTQVKKPSKHFSEKHLFWRSLEIIEGKKTLSPKNLPTIDDLKIVLGMSPAIEVILKNGGISTWVELAKSSENHLNTILNAAKVGYEIHFLTTWSDQATLAIESKWDQLRDYQELLMRSYSL